MKGEDIKPTRKRRKHSNKSLQHGTRLRDAFGMSKAQWGKLYPSYDYQKYRELIVGMDKVHLRNEFGELDTSFKHPKIDPEPKYKDAEHREGDTVFILLDNDLVSGVVTRLFISASQDNNLNYEILINGKPKYRVYHKVYSIDYINNKNFRKMVNLKKLKLVQAVAILRENKHDAKTMYEVAKFVKARGRLIEKYEKYLDYVEPGTTTTPPENTEGKKKKDKKNKIKELPSVEKDSKKKKKKKDKKVQEEVEVPAKSSKKGKKGKKDKKNKKHKENAEDTVAEFKENLKKGKKVKEEATPEVETKVAETTAPVEEYPAEYLGKHVRFKPSARVTKEYKEVRGVIVGRHIVKDAKYYRVWVMELGRISMLRITNPSTTFYKKPNDKLAEAFKATGLHITKPRRTKAEMLAEEGDTVAKEAPADNGTSEKKKDKKKKKKNKKVKV